MNPLAANNRIRGSKSYGVGLFLGFLLFSTLPLLIQSNHYILQIFTHAMLLAALALAWIFRTSEGLIGHPGPLRWGDVRLWHRMKHPSNIHQTLTWNQTCIQ